jgi:Protein of unknown function (DUF3363)
VNSAKRLAGISARTGLEYREVRAGDNLTGIYRRMLTLNCGRFALIERSHDFALVCWRPVLERAPGQMVTGSVGGRHFLVDRHQAQYRALEGFWGLPGRLPFRQGRS